MEKLGTLLARTCIVQSIELRSRTCSKTREGKISYLQAQSCSKFAFIFLSVVVPKNDKLRFHLSDGPVEHPPLLSHLLHSAKMLLGVDFEAIHQVPHTLIFALLLVAILDFAQRQPL